MKNIKLDLTYVFSGYSDYYSGHRHAFEKPSLLVCVRFGIPINYSETVKEIIDRTIESINMYELDFINEELTEQQKDEINNYLTNELIEQAIKDSLTPNTKDSDKWFYEYLEQEFKTCDNCEYDDFNMDKMKDVCIEKHLRPKDKQCKHFEYSTMNEFPVIIGYLHVTKKE